MRTELGIEILQTVWLFSHIGRVLVYLNGLIVTQDLRFAKLFGFHEENKQVGWFYMKGEENSLHRDSQVCLFVR